MPTVDGAAAAFARRSAALRLSVSPYASAVVVAPGLYRAASHFVVIVRFMYCFAINYSTASCSADGLCSVLPGEERTTTAFVVLQ